jgi:RNA polymerase sigma-70 factor (ECF subfamily)
VDDSAAELVARVYRFALRLTGDPHTAEDLAQETMLRSFSNSSSLREPKALRVWLFRTARNLWIDQVRRNLSAVSAAGHDVDGLSAPESVPSTGLETAEAQTRVLAELRTLPPKQREVLYLHACEDLSLGEIADVLQSSVNAVKTNLSLARKAMRLRLKDLFESPVRIRPNTVSSGMEDRHA